VARHVLTVDLRDDPDAVAAYRAHHAKAWPEVVASLRVAGVREMDIYLLGRRLVMILDLPDELDVPTVVARHLASADPRVAEWERLMKALQERAPAAPDSEWWAAMEPVFRLSAYADGVRRVADAVESL
jgi:L-rhamnose mutarotase